MEVHGYFFISETASNFSTGDKKKAGSSKLCKNMLCVAEEEDGELMLSEGCFAVGEDYRFEVLALTTLRQKIFDLLNKQYSTHKQEHKKKIHLFLKEFFTFYNSAISSN